jgi:molybdate transport system substrate-binding protein
MPLALHGLALRVCLGWAVAAWLMPDVARAQSAPPIAAASDLQFALDEVASAFRRESGADVRLVFGSSGNFARQIEQGAPFQLFFSADEALVFRLADKALTKDRGHLYAIGRIVLFAPHGSSLTGNLTAEGLRSAAIDGTLAHFSIANPEHAPYGRAAQEWLTTHRLWEAVRPHLVFGENASQAAQFAMTGASRGGIVPYSLALTPRLSAAGTFALLPSEEHGPLRQRMVLLKGASATAVRFHDYMTGEAAREIMRRHGFGLPDETQRPPLAPSPGG